MAEQCVCRAKPFSSSHSLHYVRLAHTRTSKIERRQDMTRMLILATLKR
jgi:hypothetical protein